MTVKAQGESPKHWYTGILFGAGVGLLVIGDHPHTLYGTMKILGWVLLFAALALWIDEKGID